MIQPSTWSLLGEALGLSHGMWVHLADACRLLPLALREERSVSAGVGHDDLLWVAGGTVRVQTTPAIAHILSSAARSRPFLLSGRGSAAVKALEPSNLVQVNGAALAHLRAWDRILARQRHEIRRRMAMIRRPLLLAGVPLPDIPMLIDSMEVLELAGRHELARQGEGCDRLYLLESGTAVARRGSVLVDELRPGDLFPRAMLDGECSDATITSCGPVRLLTLSRGDLDAVRAWALRRPEVCLA